MSMPMRFPGFRTPALFSGVVTMIKIRRILAQPGASEQLVRAIIKTSPGKLTSPVSIQSGNREYVVRATVLKQVGKKLVTP